MSAEASVAVEVEPQASISSSSGSKSKYTPSNADHIERRRQKRRMQVKRLEKKLELYHRRIKSLSEEDVSLEDMTTVNSAYIKEDFVKRKLLKTWEELCELQRIPSIIEVVHEDKEYSATSYPEINRRVQRILRADNFPDYNDVLEVVERCNTKHSLGIGEAEKLELSRRIFKDAGKIVKSRRKKDYNAYFGSHLTDEVKLENDPAIGDNSLQDTLSKNLTKGKEKLERLCEDFVVKQEQESVGVGDGSPPGDTCNLEEEEDEEEEGEGDEGVGEGGETGEEEIDVVNDEEEKLLKKKRRLDDDDDDGSGITCPVLSNGQEGSSNHGNTGTVTDQGNCVRSAAIICLSDSESSHEIVVISDSD